MPPCSFGDIIRGVCGMSLLSDVGSSSISVLLHLLNVPGLKKSGVRSRPLSRVAREALELEPIEPIECMEGVPGDRGWHSSFQSSMCSVLMYDGFRRAVGVAGGGADGDNGCSSLGFGQADSKSGFFEGGSEAPSHDDDASHVTISGMPSSILSSSDDEDDDLVPLSSL